MIDIEFVNDDKEIEKIILDPWIYDRVTDDTCPPKDALKGKNIYQDWLTVGAYLNGEIVGLIGIHDTERGPMGHMHMLKDYRDHGYDFGKRTVEALLPTYGEFFAEVPDLYPDVLGFIKKLGFEEIELLKDKHIKNGKAYDVHVLHLGEENGRNH